MLNKSIKLFNTSHAFYRTTYEYDQEHNTKARQDMRKTQTFDLAAQDQDKNRATVTYNKQKYELKSRWTGNGAL
jgi:hypothetical protein